MPLDFIAESVSMCTFKTNSKRRNVFAMRLQPASAYGPLTVRLSRGRGAEKQ